MTSGWQAKLDAEQRLPRGVGCTGRRIEPDGGHASEARRVHLAGVAPVLTDHVGPGEERSHVGDEHVAPRIEAAEDHLGAVGVGAADHLPLAWIPLTPGAGDLHLEEVRILVAIVDARHGAEEDAPLVPAPKRAVVSSGAGRR